MMRMRVTVVADPMMMWVEEVGDGRGVGGRVEGGRMMRGTCVG